MKNELGKIRVVEKDVHDFDPQGTGSRREIWWEIFDGKKWIGKAYSHKKAVRVSNEIKDGKFYDS